MSIKVSPSLMCMNILDIRSQMKVLNEKSKYLHIDIIDWHYAKNFSLSPDFIKQLSKITEVPMDAHLMVEGLNLELIEQCIDSGASMITLQADTIGKNAFTIINRIKQLHKQVGVSINPSLPLDIIKLYIHLVDKITIMTVDPGYAGQKFVNEALVKIEQARDLKRQNGFEYEIEVDGACNEKTYKELYQAGAEILVLGSSGLFNLDKDLSIAWSIMEENLFKTTQQRL